MYIQNYTFFRLLLIFSSLLLLMACKGDENKRIRVDIEKAIEIGESEPKQALQILDTIYPEHLDKKSLMLYQIADVQATRYANKPISSKQANEIVKVAEYFESKKDKKHAALAHFYAGIALEKTGQLEKGFTHYLKTYPYAREINDSILMGKSLYNQGVLYQYQNVYDSAIVYLQEALPIFQNKPLRLIKTYTSLAFNYYLINDYEKALQTIEKCTPLFTSLIIDHQNREYIREYNNVYGLISMRRGDFQKAISFLSKNMGDKKTPQKDQLRTLLNLIKTYTLAHETDSARYCIDKAMPLFICMKDKNSKSIIDHYLILWGYAVLRGYYSEIGDQEQAIAYNQLYMDKHYEIDKKNLRDRFLEIYNRIDIQQLLRENKAYTEKMAIAIFVGFILFFVFVLFFIHKVLHKKAKSDVDLQINEINQLRFELRKIKNKELRIH